MSAKTIKQISTEENISRSTVLQAAQRGVFGLSAHKSGDTWIIDTDSALFTSWLNAHWQQARVKGSSKK